MTDENSVFKEEIIADLSAKYGKPPSQIVLKSTLKRGVGVIPKTSNA